MAGGTARESGEGARQRRQHSAGDDNGAGGVTSLPSELALETAAFVFLVWIGMEKAGGGAAFIYPGTFSPGW
jgi:hypothetical protein